MRQGKAEIGGGEVEGPTSQGVVQSLSPNTHERVWLYCSVTSACGMGRNGAEWL